MNKLSVPCNWDINTAKKILNLEPNNTLKVYEMYGAIENDVIPTGRYNGALESVGKEQALEFKKKIIDKYNLKFAYLLNSPCEIESCDTKKFKDYLDWIINTFKADSLTISSYSLMEFARKLYPDIDINVSTIAGIETIDDFNKYLKIQPSRIILHHNVIRDIGTLKAIIKHSKSYKVELEVMLNESCLQKCRSRKEHYDCLASNKNDRRYHVYCNTIKVQHPYNLLLANYIRPENLKNYSELGLSLFKITGRSKPNWWLPEVVEAYMNQSYDGNLIRLLGIDPSLKAEEWIYISNKSLNGFFENLPSQFNDQVKYCKEYIIKLYNKNEFSINKEFVKYIVNKNQLIANINGDIYGKY